MPFDTRFVKPLKGDRKRPNLKKDKWNLTREPEKLEPLQRS
jgi:hypothetical protein